MKTIHILLILVGASIMTFCQPDQSSLNRTSLNGIWHFTPDSLDAFSQNNVLAIGEWRSIKVPLSWQAQFADLRDYQGSAWYHKQIKLVAPRSDERMILHFEAVDYLSKIYVNDSLIGSHEGGYTPFQFDITDAIRDGKNDILLWVHDPPGGEKAGSDLNYYHIPHGKQSWYVQNSGIWQDVYLSTRKSQHIHRMEITPDVGGRVTVSIRMNQSGSDQTIQLIARDPEHNVIGEWQAKVDAESSAVNTNFFVPSPEMWGIDQPNLYTLEAHMANGDRKVETFGFRSFETRDGKFLLNGEPIYIRAALDQDFYPQTIYSSPSEEYLRDEMIKARKLGLNMLRCHIKVPDPLYLKVADELGLLVWYEVPNWDVFTPETGQRAARLADEMLERDWNHPSLVIISLINESWGLDLRQTDQRDWLLNEFDRVKKRAINRLVVDNSACWGNFHIKTDINDYHTYWAIPENRERFTETVTEMIKRPSWLFSPHGDAVETGSEPLMLSEFGNWGLPVLPDEKPWWLGRDFLGRAVTLPTGYMERFTSYRYDEMFETYDDLALASQMNQFNALKWEIEEIRRFQDIQGYVITEFTDLNWECNGLLDMWRNFKVYHQELSDIQQSDLLIPRPDKYVVTMNEPVTIDLWLSHYTAAVLKGSRIFWQTETGQKGEIPLALVEGAGVHKLPVISVTGTAFSNPGNRKISLTLSDEKGKILSQNYTQVYVVPEHNTQPHYYLEVSEPHASMKNIAEFVGKINTDTSDESVRILITDRLDESVINQVTEGAFVLCLVNNRTVSPDTSIFKIISRESEWYDGNWASNLNWLRDKRPPFRDLNLGPVLGFEMAGMTPEYVIAELDSSYFGDVLAGMYVGWIHLNSGYIVQMKSGPGRLLLCTFPLEKSLGTQPLAEKMLRNLLDYMAGNEYMSELDIRSGSL